MDLSKFFPPSLLDQSFGLCITPEDLIFPSYNFHRTNYYRPWKWYMQRAEKDQGSTIHDEIEQFKIALDVQHFQPNEINVKVADREVIIEGKHEERQDNHGYISRQFKRRYCLPHDCNADSVFSSLSSDGVLTVTADKVRTLKNREIIVPIRLSETGTNQNISEKIQKKEVTEDIKKTDSEMNKKKMDIMLKEDHSRLLRPELLGAAGSSETEHIQTKKQMDDKVSLKTTVETCGQVADSRLSEKKEGSKAASAAKSEISISSESTSKEALETIASGITTAGMTAAAVCGMTSAKTDTMASGITSTSIVGNIEKADNFLCGMSSAGRSEKADSAGKIEKADTLLCGLSSAGKTEKADTFLCGLSSAGKTEKADTLLCGLSTSAGKAEKTGTLTGSLCGMTGMSGGKSEQTEAVACGITSEVLTEKAQTSTAAKSEISNIKSMISESIKIQETSSSSYSSSVASSIKETTEKINELVSDISAQLKEAAENI